MLRPELGAPRLPVYATLLRSLSTFARSSKDQVALNAMASENEYRRFAVASLIQLKVRKTYPTSGPVDYGAGLAGIWLNKPLKWCITKLTKPMA